MEKHRLWLLPLLLSFLKEKKKFIYFTDSSLTTVILTGNLDLKSLRRIDVWKLLQSADINYVFSRVSRGSLIDSRRELQDDATTQVVLCALKDNGETELACLSQQCLQVLQYENN